MVIEKIDLSKCYSFGDACNEVNRILAQVEEADKKIPFIETLEVAPYGYKDSFKKYYNSMKEWAKYTNSSRAILIDEFNGCIRCANRFIAEEEAPKVLVKLLCGKHKNETKLVPEWLLDDYIRLGLAELA